MPRLVSDSALGNVVVGVEIGKGFFEFLQLFGRAVELNTQQFGNAQEFA